MRSVPLCSQTHVNRIREKFRNPFDPHHWARCSGSLKARKQSPAALFADENKDACGQRHNVEQENGWPDVQAEPEKAVEDQVNPEQKHADVFVEFHDFDLLDRLLG
jgi:hypothetical protein